MNSFILEIFKRLPLRKKIYYFACSILAIYLMFFLFSFFIIILIIMISALSIIGVCNKIFGRKSYNIRFTQYNVNNKHNDSDDEIDKEIIELNPRSKKK